MPVQNPAAFRHGPLPEAHELQGANVGAAVEGILEGTFVGLSVVGNIVGLSVGEFVGTAVVGEEVGVWVGESESHMVNPGGQLIVPVSNEKHTPPSP